MSIYLSRFYVGTLKLTLNQVKLSVQKSIKLRPDLQVSPVFLSNHFEADGGDAPP